MLRRVNLLIDYGSQDKVVRLSLAPWLLWVIVPAFVLFIGSAIYSIVSRAKIEVDRQALVQLRKENKLLESQYENLKTQIDSLNTTLAFIGRHDLELRVQSNMDVLPEDARKLGVGGQSKEGPQLEGLSEMHSAKYRSVSEISGAVDELLRKAKYQRESFENIEVKLKDDAFLRDHTPSILPTNGWLCSGFGYRIDPFTGMVREHKGVDISNAAGTPIVSPANGVVCYTGVKSGYGLCVEIDHGNQISSFFGHLSGIYVKNGQQVTRGEVVAAMGATGRTTGTHLHYEVHVAGRPVNPLNYVIDSEHITD